MTLRTRISLALTLWFVAEAVALALVVQEIGVGGAILLGLATSLLGGSLLKRAGGSALSALRQSATGPDRSGILRGDVALDRTLGVVGALFLVLPGFLTDAIGLVLATPLFRAAITRRIQAGGFRAVHRQPRAQHGPTSIDLGPDDWRPVDDEARRPLPKV